eukprot:CAMPEP_0116882052 /NCGR_PEP_ID=MMETSP0463-20121206/14192_1 /TAXON_ID=181622 /ORGANISM="Strombidinopsis sp, Strain SopsisLIS2011" /LENGTH=51 /DNA_ID=CAMNT_0004534667 /DNA_START=801 /DNA_END=956 /DNA_ORIENTATION=+
MQDEEIVITHSIKRVKKKINDFILHSYNELFFKDQENTSDALAASDILSNP